MTREQLAKKLAKKVGLKNAKAEKLISSFGDSISEALLRDEKVVYSNFGTFYKVHYPSKVIYHPQLGQAKKMVMLPTDVVKWMPADNIKRLCNADIPELEESVIKHGASKVSKKIASDSKSKIAENQSDSVLPTPHSPLPSPSSSSPDESEEYIIPVRTSAKETSEKIVSIDKENTAAPATSKPVEATSEDVSIYEEVFENGGKEESTFGDVIRVPRRPSLWSRISRKSESSEDIAPFSREPHSYLPSSGLSYDSAALRLVPEKLARTHNLAPIKLADNTLTLAMTDPDDYEARSVISKVTKKNLSVVLVSKSDLETIQQSYQNLPSPAGAETERKTISDDVPHPPIARTLAALFRKAIRSQSSHIHFDPYDDGFRIRLRREGKLEKIFDLPPTQATDATSEFMRLAHLDPSSDLPQDGSFTLKFEDRQVDFHISTMPILSGNKIVIKIIDQIKTLRKIEEFGLEPREISSLKQILSKKKGLIVFAGEKSSTPIMTMYSALAMVQSPDKIVMTIENPIVSRLKEVQQIQVDDKRDLTFAKALHSALAQDPDVICLSDIPDRETLETALQAALTGHLVIASISAESTPEALKKLIDMGSKPQALSVALLAVIAQRDCFGLCRECRQKALLADTQLDSLQAFINNMPRDVKSRYSAKTGSLYSIVGCKKCSGSGYADTINLLEYLPITEEMREIIVKKSALTTIQRQATKENVITLNQRKIMLALEGKVAIETP